MKLKVALAPAEEAGKLALVWRGTRNPPPMYIVSVSSKPNVVTDTAIDELLTHMKEKLSSGGWEKASEAFNGSSNEGVREFVQQHKGIFQLRGHGDALEIKLTTIPGQLVNSQPTIKRANYTAEGSQPELPEQQQSAIEKQPADPEQSPGDRSKDAVISRKYPEQGLYSGYFLKLSKDAFCGALLCGASSSMSTQSRKHEYPEQSPAETIFRPRPSSQTATVTPLESTCDILEEVHQRPQEQQQQGAEHTKKKHKTETAGNEVTPTEAERSAVAHKRSRSPDGISLEGVAKRTTADQKSGAEAKQRAAPVVASKQATETDGTASKAIKPVMDLQALVDKSDDNDWLEGDSGAALEQLEAEQALAMKTGAAEIQGIGEAAAKEAVPDWTDMTVMITRGKYEGCRGRVKKHVDQDKYLVEVEGSKHPPLEMASSHFTHAQEVTRTLSCLYHLSH